MLTGLKAYGAAMAAFLLLDGLWLGWIARDFYANRLQSFMTGPVNWPVAGLFYAIYVLGIVYLVSLPAARAGSGYAGGWRSAFLRGGVLGVSAYGTYDLTNLATLPGWPFDVVVVDMIWGAAVTAAVACAGCLAAGGYRN